jgi:hypothetical protein
MGRDGFAVSLFVQEQRRYSSLGSGYTSTTAGHSDVAAPGRNLTLGLKNVATACPLAAELIWPPMRRPFVELSRLLHI